MADTSMSGPGRGQPRGLFDRPILLLVATALMWAGNVLAGQWAVDEISPFQLTLLRWILVAALLWALYGRDVVEHWAVIRPRLWLVVLMATMGFTMFNALFYVAAYETSGVNIGILQGSMPMFILIGSVVVHRTGLSPLQAAGVMTTVVGVALIATQGDPRILIETGLNPGDAIMLLACVLYSAYTVALQARPKIPGRAFFTLMAPIAAVTALPLAVVEAIVVAPPLPSLQGWLVLLYVALFPSCLAQLTFLRGVDLIGAGRAGVFINLVPIFAAGLAVLVLGEAFRWYHGLALLLVLGGIWLAERHGRPAA